MKRVSQTAALAAIACGMVRAQEFDRLDACMDKAITNLAIHVCADEEAIRVDAELNGTYQKLLSAASKEPGAVARIRFAEREWLAYRDAYVDAMYPAKDKLAAYGSIYTTEVLLLRAKLTRQQIDALHDLLKQYKGEQ